MDFSIFSCEKMAEENTNDCKGTVGAQSDTLRLYTCRYCGDVFNFRQTFSLHVEKFHSNNCMRCTDCNYYGLSVLELIHHMKVEHNRDSGSCPRCDFKSGHLRKLVLHFQEGHMKTSNSLNPVKDKPVQTVLKEIVVSEIHCKECSYRTRYHEYLKEHMRMMHSNSGPAGNVQIKYACMDCNYIAEAKHNLREHIRNNHYVCNDEQFFCPKCDHCSRSGTSLSNAAFDENIDPFDFEIPSESSQILKQKCTYCSYSTNVKMRLKLHIESVHWKIKKFVCKHCNYKSPRKHNLVRHINSVHLGIRYPCSQCPHIASSSSNLWNHVRIKHSHIKYECTKCTFSTVWKNHLKGHLKAVHGSEAEI